MKKIFNDKRFQFAAVVVVAASSMIHPLAGMITLAAWFALGMKYFD
jgi:hypothetical protein